MKRNAIALCAFLASGPAVACTGYLPTTCPGCTVTATVRAQVGRVCGLRIIQGLVAMTGARVTRQPQYGRVGLRHGVIVNYLPTRAGADSFTVQLAARDRNNRPSVSTIHFQATAY
jgi:hypothetical protein